MERAWKRVVAVAALVVMAGCGGGGGGGGGKDTTLDSANANRDDQTLARDANLAISDFPPEWKSTPVDPSTTSANTANNRALADCMGRPAPDTLRTALVDSNDFSSLVTRRVSSSVQVMKNQQDAVDDFTALRTEKALACHRAPVEAEFRRQLPNSAPQVSIDRFTLPQFGDESVGMRIDAISLAEGGQVRTFIDLVFMRKGKVELSASFINRDAPFPTDLQNSLLQRMIGRG